MLALDGLYNVRTKLLDLATEHYDVWTLCRPPSVSFRTRSMFLVAPWASLECLKKLFSTPTIERRFG